MRAYILVLIGLVFLVAGVVIGVTPHQPIASPWVTGFLATFLVIYGLILAGVGLVDLDPPIRGYVVNWPGVGVMTFYIVIVSAGLVTLWFAVKIAFLWFIGLL